MSIETPEDFDLHDALHARSTTDERDKKRCPECHSSCVAPHTQKWGQSAEDYRCELCSHTFDAGDVVTGLTDQEAKALE